MLASPNFTLLHRPKRLRKKVRICVGKWGRNDSAQNGFGVHRLQKPLRLSREGGGPRPRTALRRFARLAAVYSRYPELSRLGNTRRGGARRRGKPQHAPVAPRPLFLHGLPQAGAKAGSGDPRHSENLGFDAGRRRDAVREAPGTGRAAPLCRYYLRALLETRTRPRGLRGYRSGARRIRSRHVGRRTLAHL